MFKEELHISKDYTLRDYLNLKLHINSSEKIWEKAIKMFKSRIKERYFDAIDKLYEEEMYKYGFAIMTLECLLIDTFVKFRYGPNATKSGKYIKKDIENAQSERFRKYEYAKENKRRFRIFLEEFLIIENDAKLVSEKFYEDIRCGIMHYGLTENTSRLTCDDSKLFTILKNGDISVDVYIMKKKLEDYFNTYIQEIRNSDNTELRNFFILAMNYSCNVIEKI